MKQRLSLFIALGAFCALVLYSGRAADGARQGLSVCASALVPSLLPFFTLSHLLNAMSLPDLLSGLAGRPMERLFRVSGAGVQAFLLGLSGGYPLGAAVTAELRREGIVSRREAERLLAFCNNSGPAFILGAAGGVFRSAEAGLLLFAAHALAAVCTGVVFRGGAAGEASGTVGKRPPLPFRQAFPAAVQKALSSTLSVCGYVVLFSALLACLPFLSALPPLPRTLVTGFFELGSGFALFSGMPPTPATLAAAALLLGWGGLSVHAQTLAAVGDTDISCARHLLGRALCGVLAAVFTYAGAALLL